MRALIIKTLLSKNRKEVTKSVSKTRFYTLLYIPKKVKGDAGLRIENKAWEDAIIALEGDKEALSVCMTYPLV